MIPVNLIRQYYFCPRIVYYQLLTNIKPMYPRHVSMGQQYHDSQDKLSKNRRFKKLKIEYEQKLSSLYLEDETLGISAITDLAFVCSDEVVPLEFKFIQNSKPSHSHRMQLVGYGLLMEKRFEKPCKRAVVAYSNNLKIFHLQISQKYKDEFFKTLAAIKKIEDSQLLPNSSADENKCGQCEYLNFCDDRI